MDPVCASPSQDPAIAGVLYYWQIDLRDASSDQVEDAIPSPFQDLVFPIGGTIEILDDLERIDLPYMCSLLSGVVPLRFSKGMTIFGIRMLPEFCSLLTGLPMEGLPRCNDLSKILSKRKYDSITDLVFGCPNFEERRLALDKLFARWSRDIIHTPRVDQVIQMAQCIRGNANIKMNDVYKELNGSVRSNNQLFKQHIGVTPKEYQQLVRFNKALELYRSSPDPNLAQIADEAGYSDQSHFTRASSKYAGTSPRKLFPEEWLNEQFNHT